MRFFYISTHQIFNYSDGDSGGIHEEQDTPRHDTRHSQHTYRRSKMLPGIFPFYIKMFRFVYIVVDTDALVQMIRAWICIGWILYLDQPSPGIKLKDRHLTVTKF